ncbi:MAG: glycosyltransferase family 2 protein [Planctomycetota bacterium]|nr:glycosyltransferase family 2 protein [Planctomycetota bacterium]
MAFGIVVPAYNGVDWLRECVSSVLSQRVSLVLVVVDNASTDTTSELANELLENDSRFVYVKQKENMGFASAVNAGCRELARFNPRYIMLLNQDAKLAPASLEMLEVTASREFGVWDIFTPRQMSYDGTQLDPVFLRSLQLSRIFQRDPDRSVYQVGNINGASMCFSPALFHAVGGFDDGFFMYGEDTDFVKRAKMIGAKCFAVMGADIFHEHTARDYTDPMVRFGYNNRVGYERLRLKDPNKTFAILLIVFFARALAIPFVALLRGGGSAWSRTVKAYFSVLWAIPDILRKRQVALMKTLEFRS